MSYENIYVYIYVKLYVLCTHDLPCLQSLQLYWLSWAQQRAHGTVQLNAIAVNRTISSSTTLGTRLVYRRILCNGKHLLCF